MTTATNTAVSFEAKSPGRLPVPRSLGCLMVGVFGVPVVMLIATTWREVPNYPWLLAVYLAALFPLAALYAVKRLMKRYRLRVYADGAVEVAFPFRTVRIGRSELASVGTSTTHLAAAGGHRTFVVLASSDGRVLASFSPSAFGPGAVEAFLDALRRANPGVVIRR